MFETCLGLFHKSMFKISLSIFKSYLVSIVIRTYHNLIGHSMCVCVLV